MTIAGPGDQDWLPCGEEPHAAGSITHCKILRNDGICSVSLPSGDIDASIEPATGIYFRDTRYLSQLTLSLGGVPCVLLDPKQSPFALTAIFTNPAMHLPDGRLLPRQSLVIRRQRVLDEAVLEVLSISNYDRAPVTVELRVSLDADFHDIFEVRGFERRSALPHVEAATNSNGIVYSCTGADGTERKNTVRFSPAPHRVSETGATFLLALAPRETADVEVRMFLQAAEHFRSGAQAAVRVEANQRSWLEGITHISTDNEVMNSAIDRAFLDVRALKTRVDDCEFVAAGAPWFDTLFGRDSLITGMELVAFAPDILRNALIVLARYQADSFDAAHDAEPGKIPHELRWGELAMAGEVPFAQYYGSVDVTPLFIVAADEYLRWTDDSVTIKQLWPAIERAMQWCMASQDRDPNGFLSYARVSVSGLEHQGWKDSSDGISWPDGRGVEPPIALVEVQGYLAAAFASYARLAAIAGESSGDATARLDALLANLDARFGDPARLGYALCLQGNGLPVDTTASNSGHLLWLGTARKDLAKGIARSLMSPDMFSGWGIRTLSTDMTGFNPIGYHTGSVWPHDNALILAGMRRYGFDAEALQLGSALLQMAMAFPDYQVPELFSGDARDLRSVPTPYPVSSRPQAWSAASVPFALISLLGIRPLPRGRISITRPLLPEGVQALEVQNLRRGNGTVDLLFTSNGGRIAVEVENIRGDIEVVLSQSVHPAVVGTSSPRSMA